MRQPDACIVRITDAEGNTLGTGCVVSTDGRIATCHHVVKETRPCVVFPGGKSRKAQIITSDPTHDVAILKLEGELPPGAEPARLGYSTEGHYSDFRSRGYRPMGEMQGIPAEGRVLHAVSEYSDMRYLPLILKSQDIRQGMSGAPVYIPGLDLVVGMITGYWDSLKAGTGFRDAETGFAVPVEAITALCPDIPIHGPSPKFRRSLVGVPFQVPAVPRYFVPRPEVSNDLKAQLLSDEATAPGTLVVSAVHGLGGIGKTTLVAALAHDPELHNRFPDGILWVTLGHQPDILSLLLGWIQALGDYGFRPTVIESASTHLRTLLHDKNCLLVVDDAWRADQVRSFLVGGERCRVLVTTRDVTLTLKVGAESYDLDVMTEGQALALFEARLGSLKGNRGQAAVLARELGFLPLALELAAAQVKAGYSWDELLDTFHQELADLARLDLDEATHRNESLRLSFRLSLERLSLDDQEAFAWLGVLPEDARLSPAMATTLWDQPEVDARRRLYRLRDKALLKPVGDDNYIVHDLLHDEAKLQLAERMSLPEAHAAFLERYQRRTDDGQWHALPLDGYIHAHLTWHMEQAGRIESIHALLRDRTADGRNAWFEACIQRGEEETGSYVADVMRAWKVAELAQDLALQVRYALIVSSIHSLAQKLPTKLLAGILQYKSKLMSATAVFSNMRQLPLVYERADALHDLAPFLPESLLPDALEMALAIARENERGLLGLAPVLTPELLEQALLRLSKATDEFKQAWFLSSVAPTMPSALHSLGLFVSRQIRDPGARALALSSFVPRLSDDLRQAVIAQALEAAAVTPSLSLVREALLNLAAFIPAVQIEETWQSARGCGGDLNGRNEDSFVFLAQAYAKKHMIEKALSALEHVSSGHYRYEAISHIAPMLEETQLVRLLDHLPHEGDYLIAAKELGKSLGILARYGPRSLRCRLWALTRSIASTDDCKLIALGSIAFYMDEDDIQSQIWAEVSALLQRIGRRWDPWHVAAYEEVVQYLPIDLIHRFIEMLGDKTYRQHVALASLNRLSGAAKERICSELLAEAVAGNLKTDPLVKAHPLTALPSHLSETERETLFAAALQRARIIGDKDAFEHSLVPLQALLSGVWEQRSRCEDVREHDHVRVLLTMAPYAPHPTEVAQVALQALDALTPLYFSASLLELIPLLPFLNLEQREQTLGRILDAVDQRFEVHDHEILWSSVARPNIADDPAILWSDMAQPNIVDVLHMLLAHTNGEERRRVVEHVMLLTQGLPNLSVRLSLLTILFQYLPEMVRESLRTEVVQWLKEHAEPPEPDTNRRHVPLVRALVLAHISATALPEEHEALLREASIAIDKCAPEAIMRAACFLPREVTLPILETTASDTLRSQSWYTKLAACLWLPDELKVGALLECLREVMKKHDASTRDWMLIALVGSWVRLPRQDMYRIWAEILPVMAQANRSYLLAGVHATAPVLLALGGERAVAEVVHAIQDVGRWWP